MQEKTRQLQCLYGKQVLPDELVHFFNGSLSDMEVTVASGVDEGDIYGRACHLLLKYLLFIEEKPTPTRFWTFTVCVNAILRM